MYPFHVCFFLFVFSLCMHLLSVWVYYYYISILHMFITSQYLSPHNYNFFVYINFYFFLLLKYAFFLLISTPYIYLHRICFFLYICFPCISSLCILFSVYVSCFMNLCFQDSVIMGAKNEEFKDLFRCQKTSNVFLLFKDPLFWQ